MPSIVIADSDFKARRTLVRALERVGWEVWYAFSTAELGALLECHDIDLVVISAALAAEEADAGEAVDHQAEAIVGPFMIVLPAESGPPHADRLQRVAGMRSSTRTNSMVMEICRSVFNFALPASSGGRIKWGGTMDGVN